MNQCVNPVSRHEGKKSALPFSNNFVNIFWVFLNVIYVIFMESMLVYQNQQQSFQPFLVAVMLVEISRTSKMKFKDFQEHDLFSRISWAWKMKKSRICTDYSALSNRRQD